MMAIGPVEPVKMPPYNYQKQHFGGGGSASASAMKGPAMIEITEADRQAQISELTWAAEMLSRQPFECSLGVLDATKAGKRCDSCTDATMPCYKIGRVKDALKPFFADVRDSCAALQAREDVGEVEQAIASAGKKIGGGEAALVLTRVLSDGSRFVLMSYDHYLHELRISEERGRKKAAAPAEPGDVLREAAGMNIRPALTEASEKILRFIESYHAANGVCPTTVEIQRAGIYSSLEQIARILDVLERFGYISREYGRKRNIALLKNQALASKENAP